MEITDIRIFKTNKKGPVLAYANIILNNCFIVRGITLVETEKNGRFISMPSRRLRGEKKTFRDMCHPLNSEIRENLTKMVFEAYDNFIENEKE